MRVSIKANTKEMEDRLSRMVRQQLPFAMTRTVTQVATMTRNQEMYREYNKFFEMRNKPFFRSVHSVAPAQLRFTKQTGVAIASIQRQDSPRPVGTLPARGGRKAYTSFMTKHASGGIKTPKGKLIAVPISDANLPRKKGGRKAGAIVEGKQPKALMQGRGFIVNTKKGKTVLFRRVGRGKKSNIEAMYHLQPSASIKGGYNPMGAARKGVTRWFRPTFTLYFKKAMQTAKLR